MQRRDVAIITHPVTLWSGFALVLYILRAAIVDVPHPRFLLWNLFLAIIPFAVSLVIARSKSRALNVVLGAIWLAFLPNAFYILTDLIHLPHFAARRQGSSGPVYLRNQDVMLGFDITLLISFAIAGFACGYGSLRRVEKGFGLRGLPRFLFVHVILWLSAFGIYLGRVLRFNSWDLLNRSGSLVGESSQSMNSPREFLAVVLFIASYGTLLSLGYYTVFNYGRRVVGQTNRPK